MKPHDKDYHDYSHRDAPHILDQVLTYFFLDENNVKTYSLPKKHFDNIKVGDTFANARRYFTIITGTNLVTNKIVTSYRTSQGTRYLVRKDYYQLVERMMRKEKREQIRQVQQPASKSPFVEYLTLQTNDDKSTSSSDDDIPSQHPPPTVVDKTPVSSERQQVYKDDDISKDEDDSTINTQLTKLATAVETEMDKALTDMTDDKEDDLISEEDKITTTIQSVFKNELSTIMTRLEHKEQTLDKQIQKNKTLNQTLRDNIDSFHRMQKELTKTTEKLTNKYSYVTRVIDELRQEFDDFKNDTTIENNVVKRIDEKFQKLQRQNRKDNDDQTTTSKSLIQDSHEKLTRRISRLKDKSNSLFEQHDVDYELLTDRVQRLERNYANLHPHSKIKKRLSYSSENSRSSNDKPAQSPPTYTSFNTPQHGYKNTYYRGPNLDYLRKNVNVTCTAQNQILEFYIKFRLALEPGGIHIIPIDQINKHKSIAQDKPGVTIEDQRLQSNALFTLLSNEKIIPQDFTMAQNCILGFASNMDGFGALRAMLKLTHPNLSKKRPSNTPPVLSESNDIHAYEQNLRNYYLLHKLFSDTEYAPIEKAKQFLQGIDDGQYNDAVQRVQHQLDTIETLNVPLHEDYDIENIASTIINISGEYENTKTIVNTMNQRPPRYNNRRHTQYSSMRKRHENYNPPSQTYKSDKIDKTQCFACKTFGHTVTHCKLLPRVLAVLQFKSKYNEKCATILDQHIRNNTIDSKRTFVRTLQNMEILSLDEDCDDHLEHDIIINTITDNGFNDRDFLSDEE